MAVVQISKIQVRRGQKNSNSGIPQLSSAEFAWALDSQELFIGNGSVADGAPYVGNTKILTEHDNILALIGSYQYASTDTSITLSTPRPLQDKLDEYVSVADFGAVGDGSTDCVAAFETAFSQLFQNVNSNFKKVLLIPNGEYLFSSGLRIPTGTILRGETKLGVVLNIGDNNVRFITSEGEEISEFDSTNRPININISNLTIKRLNGEVVLSGVADSLFENIKFLGEYELNDPYASIPVVEIKQIEDNVCTTTGTHNLEINDRFIPRTNGNGLTAGTKYYVRSIPSPTQFTLGLSTEGSAITLANGGLTLDEDGIPIPISIVGDIISDVISSLSSQPAAVYWNNTTSDTKVDNIKFKNCEFEANCVSVRCLHTTDYFNTAIKFEDCKFFINDTSIYIQGKEEDITKPVTEKKWQEHNWQIVDCEFTEIFRQAFRSTNGRGTTIQRSKFTDCGNGIGNPETPIDSIIYFGEKVGNLLLDCLSDRQQEAGVNTLSTTKSFIPEVYNGNQSKFINRNYSVIRPVDGFATDLATFSALSRYIVVNYLLTLGNRVNNVNLEEFSRIGKLTISIGDNLSQLSITDEYQYSPNTVAPTLGSDGGLMMTKFEFTATLQDRDTDSGIDTVVLSYKNPTSNNAYGSISFDVTYGV
jgi:hypothetical protein